MSSFRHEQTAEHASAQQPAADTTGNTTRATIFDIQLLVDNIARHLTTCDIYHCTLVSHQFHNAFQRSLFTCISIRKEATLAKFSRWEAVRAVSGRLSHVKELSIDLGECVEYLLKEASLQRPIPSAPGSPTVLFKNLTVFRFQPPRGLLRDYQLKSYSTSILALLEASPVLQVLHLSCFETYDLGVRLARIIREKGRQLKEFRIDDPKMIHWKLFFILLCSCAAVEILQMGFGPYPYNPQLFVDELAFARDALSIKGTASQPAPSEPAEKSQDTDTIEFAWKELGPGSWLVSPEFEMIHEILKMCPFLERLVFPELNEQDVVTHLAPLVATTMPRLCHLDLTHISNQPLGISSLVQACSGLISLNLDRLQFDSTHLVDILVSGHGHSLQSLNIQRSAKLSSQELNLILSSCPRLISLHALASGYSIRRNTVALSPILDTKGMAVVPEEPGWCCKDLETLKLCYSGEDTNIGIPEVLWGQIAQLSKLKDLRLYRHTSSKGPPVGEKESVRQAVSSWAILSDLRRLELRALSAFVDETLMSTARNQWTKLEWVRYKYD
ncbi:hypothetical protein BGZ72_011106 [Mortierella alpina]|nr:hypothetical protein BGZ72_011106 [Mortierella alpina]